MSDKEKIVLSWSGGKDSAMALHELRRSGRYKIVSLLTTVAEEYGRISHHGVRAELVELQAEAVGETLHKAYLPAHTTNEKYEAVVERTMLEYKDAGIRTVAFGDIFLRDLREYRKNNLANVRHGGHLPDLAPGHGGDGPDIHRPGLPGTPVLRGQPKARRGVRRPAD